MGLCLHPVSDGFSDGRLARVDQCRWTNDEYAGSSGTNAFPESPASSRVREWKGKDGLFDWFDENSPLNVSEIMTEWMLLVLVKILDGEFSKLKQRTNNSQPDEKFR
jgi:hypothetical protein